MQARFRSLVPSLLLAAGILGATAVSLWSATSLAWALAGPLALAVVVIAAKAVSNRLLSRADSYVPAMIMAGGVFASGAMVAFGDPASMPMFMPILGACTAMVLTPRRCVAPAVSSGGR
jgi:hypothetical protein